MLHFNLDKAKLKTGYSSRSLKRAPASWSCWQAWRVAGRPQGAGATTWPLQGAVFLKWMALLVNRGEVGESMETDQYLMTSTQRSCGGLPQQESSRSGSAARPRATGSIRARSAVSLAAVGSGADVGCHRYVPVSGRCKDLQPPRWVVCTEADRSLRPPSAANPPHTARTSLAPAGLPSLWPADSRATAGALLCQERGPAASVPPNACAVKASGRLSPCQLLHAPGARAPATMR